MNHAPRKQVPTEDEGTSHRARNPEVRPQSTPTRCVADRSKGHPADEVQSDPACNDVKGARPNGMSKKRDRDEVVVSDDEIEVIEPVPSNKKRLKTSTRPNEGRPSSSIQRDTSSNDLESLVITVQAQGNRLDSVVKQLDDLHSTLAAIMRESKTRAQAGNNFPPDSEHESMSTKTTSKAKRDPTEDGKPVTAPKKDTLLKRYTQVMLPLVPYREEVFCAENLQACILRCSLQEVLDVMEKSNNDLTPAGLLTVFNTLTFSRKATETKVANAEGAGPQGNEFFSKVLMLCVSQSQKISLDNSGMIRTSRLR